MPGLFPMPDLEPPTNEPSWGAIAGLVAAAVVCIVVVLAVAS